MNAEEVVEHQLAAYNRHDVEAFCACYAEDAVIRHADGRVLMTGRDAIRARYAQLFRENPDLCAKIRTRLKAGEWVVDEEHVQLGQAELHVVVGYLVRGDVIQSVVMIRSDL